MAAWQFSLVPLRAVHVRVLGLLPIQENCDIGYSPVIRIESVDGRRKSEGREAMKKGAAVAQV